MLSLFPSCCLTFSNRVSHTLLRLTFEGLAPRGVAVSSNKTMLLSAFHIKILIEKEPHLKKMNYVCFFWSLPSVCVLLDISTFSSSVSIAFDSMNSNMCSSTGSL